MRDVRKLVAICVAVLMTAFFATLFDATLVEGATIDVAPLESGGQALVTVTGPFEYSDIDQFRTKTSQLSKAVVAFASPGGNLKAGLEIGTMLRLKGFISFVPDGAQCASACALAWLGGAKRLMGPTAQVGFHAASVVKDGITSETSVGNALVGAYLNRIGLPDQAVIYITQAAPQDITWLSIEDAEKLGIDVELFSPTVSSRNPPPPMPEPSTSLNAPEAKPNAGQPSSGRYARSECGSIFDSATGLEWIVGPNIQIDWPEAVDWVQKLRACGKSWGMPSPTELRTLYDKQYSAGSGYLTRGRRWPAHIQPIFSEIGEGSWVWADREGASGGAIAVNFNQGIDVTIPQHGFDGTVRVFAVNRENGNAANVVRRFYQALALGDGDQASGLLLPEKRNGALAPESITAYYSRLLEPLALISLQSSGADNFLVRYRFRSNKIRCDGLAVVMTMTRGDDVLIAHIKALNGC